MSVNNPQDLWAWKSQFLITPCLCSSESSACPVFIVCSQLQRDSQTMSINFNSIDIIWGWDWMSPPQFEIGLPWIQWVGLPWACPIITIACTPHTQVKRPIYIKVCRRRNLPHCTRAGLATLHYLPPTPPGTRTRLRITRQDEVQIWGLPSSELTSPSDPAWPAPPSPQDGTLPVSLAPRNSHICCSGETTTYQANV